MNNGDAQAERFDTVRGFPRTVVGRGIGTRDADVRPNLGHHMQHLSDRDDVVATQWPRMECVGASTSMVSVAIFASASRAGTAQQVVRMITNSWAIMRT